LRIVGGYSITRDGKGRPRPLELRREDFQGLGDEVCVWPQAKIVNTELVSIGSRTIIDDFVLIIAGEQPIIIGSFVHIASFCSITGRGGFVIEDFAGFAAGVRVATSDEDYAGGSCLTNPTIPPEYRNARNAPVRIEKHAIVGTNTVILPGVTVGEGCAVGANALVTRDLPPWSVCVGIPAKPVKDRPRERILEMENELLMKYPQYKSMPR
jgi:acetyltransferase-like isoleucine patch superfamily enzyme